MMLVNPYMIYSPPVVTESYDEIVLGDSPVLYYKLDEVSGETAYNSIEANYNLTIYGTPTLNNPSLLPSGEGYSKLLNGSPQTIYGTINKSGLSLRSLEFIFKPTVDTGASDCTVLSMYQNVGGFNKFFRVGYRVSDSLLWLSVNDTLTNSRSGIALQGVYHIVVAEDSNGFAGLFVNGVGGYSTYSSQTPLSQFSSGVRLSLSHFYNGVGMSDYASMAIDNVSLYSQQLSQQQITEHYNASISSVASSDPYWNNVDILLDMEDELGTSNFVNKGNLSTGFTNVNSPTIVSGGSFGTKTGSFSSDRSLKTTSTLSLSGDFTIEMFIVDPLITSNTRMIFSFGPNTLNLYSVTGTAMYLYIAGSFYFFSNSGVTTSCHIAVTRSSGVIRYYVNGIKKYERSSSIAINAQFNIGTWNSVIGSSCDFYDEVRITNGVARYTGASYSVPTTPFPIG